MDETPLSPPARASGMAQLEGYVERLRVQLPEAPPNILDAYARFFPWVSIVVGAFFLLLLIGLLALGAVIAPLAVLFGGVAGAAAGGAYLLTVILWILLTVLGIYGGYLMLKTRATGWWIVGAGLLVNVLQSLLHGQLVLLIVTLLFAYVHVQVRPRYS